MTKIVCLAMFWSAAVLSTAACRSEGERVIIRDRWLQDKESTPGSSGGSSVPSPFTPASAPGAVGMSGNGGGYNGPTLFGLSIPPHPDRQSLENKSVQAYLTCLMKGDAERGLKSFYGRLSEVLWPEVDVEACYRLGEDSHSDKASRQLDVKLIGHCAKLSELIPAENMSQEDAVEGSGPEESGGLKFRAGLSADAPLLQMAEKLPVVVFTSPTQEVPELSNPNGPRVQTEILSQQILLWPKNAENLGPAVRLLNSATQQPTDYTVNVQEYVQCLQGEAARPSGLDEDDHLVDSGAALSVPDASAICGDFDDWKAVRNQEVLSPALSPQARVAHKQAEWTARQELGDRLFARYMKGELLVGWEKSCLAGIKDKQNVIYTITQQFYENSVRQLKSVKRPTTDRFVRALIAATQDGSWVLLHQQMAESHHQNHKAGVHRADGSIFADFHSIKPNEWPIIFVHEMSHQMDNLVFGGARQFSVKSSEKEIQRILNAHKDASTLTALERQILRKWLRSGLQRGLWAEYRAWLVTVKVYQELRTIENGAYRVDWMEDLLREVEPDTNKAKVEPAHTFERRLYLYLDSRSQNPQVGLVAHPVALELLKELRQDVRQSRRVPALGRLKEILQ